MPIDDDVQVKPHGPEDAATDKVARRTIASNWRAATQGTRIRGYVDIHLPSSWKIHDVVVHETASSRWLQPPGRPVLDKQGRQRIGTNGKPMVVATLSCDDPETWEKSQSAGLAAVDRLLKGGES
jgi:hypothetical protein